MDAAPAATDYQRYQIQTAEAPDLAHMPNRFIVKVGKLGLALHLARELRHRRGAPHWKEVVNSRPCVYGVFGRVVGGFWPRPRLCVGCLRCTVENPEFVEVRPNPQREAWGDSFLTPKIVATIDHEARNGNVPVKGQGYRGRLGGPGWDGMWTDMSEIVRPTRDGIHGREHISTVIDIGGRSSFLEFTDTGALKQRPKPSITLPMPMVLDRLPPTTGNGALYSIMAEAAGQTRTLAIIPVELVAEQGLTGDHVVPLVNEAAKADLGGYGLEPAMVEIEGADYKIHEKVARLHPETITVARLPYGPELEEQLLKGVEAGVGVFHLTADYHGRDLQGHFVLDSIRSAHTALVQAGLRDAVTLLGSGGVACAEHVPKSIICGLDGVALDTPLLAALQCKPLGECADIEASRFEASHFDRAWGAQRVVNLLNAWRDQLLEIMGAMGLREVRRLRGEIGRAMFQADLEAEAFAEVEGYG